MRRLHIILLFCWLAVLLLCLFFPAIAREAATIPDLLQRVAPYSAVKLSRVASLGLVLLSLYTGWYLAGRPAGDLKPGGLKGRGLYAGLVLIVAGGALLRLYGLEFGLPDHFHPDEGRKAAQVLAMLARGDPDPHLFYHPSFLLYCTALFGKLLGLVQSPESRQAAILIAGRGVSAVAGTVSIVLLFFLARRLAGPRRALTAAALFAVAPVSVTCSRYLKEDALLVAGALAAVLLWVVSVQEERPALFLLAGLASGIAASTKYTGFLLIPMLAAWPWLVSGRLRPEGILLRWTGVALVLAALAFLIGTPFALVNPRDVANGFLFEARHAVEGHYTSLHQALFRIGPWSQWWMYHWGRSAVPGLTLLPSILGLLGLGILLRRGRMEALFVIGFFLLFFLPAEIARSKPHPPPERYILGAMPFLCIAAAEVPRFLARRGIRGLNVILLVLLIGSPLVRSARLAADLGPDTRTRLVSWLPHNLPEGSRILLDTSPTYSGRLRRAKLKGLRCKFGSAVRWKEARADGFTHVVESSFGSGRFLEQPNTHDRIQGELRALRGEAELLKEFRSSSGSYGFHNPRLRVYRLNAE